MHFVTQETKGVGGLVTTPSTKNLSKFFTDSAAAGNDGDGKSFFDSFTVSESSDKTIGGVAHSLSQESQAESTTGEMIGCTLSTGWVFKYLLSNMIGMHNRLCFCPKINTWFMYL